MIAFTVLTMIRHFACPLQECFSRWCSGSSSARRTYCCRCREPSGTLHRYGHWKCALILLHFLSVTVLRAEEKPFPQPWGYAEAMKKVAGKFRGREGVVLHIGDSISHANPYGQWPRGGEGKTAEDKAVLKWMHLGADDESDGWWLARFDHPDGGRSYTACGGIRADEMLAGGKQHMPPLDKLLDTYKPRIVVFMLGTNDASAGRSVEAYQADIAKSIDLMLERGIIPILSTVPPHPGRPDTAKAYNDALRKLAKKREIPLIDYEQEILKRRPDDWNGTLLGKNDVHPTAGVHGTKTTSPPTAENLRNNGYLLRGWLSVKKIAEVKRTVLDQLPAPPRPKSPQTRELADEAVRRAVIRSIVAAPESPNYEPFSVEWRIPVFGSAF